MNHTAATARIRRKEVRPRRIRRHLVLFGRKWEQDSFAQGGEKAMKWKILCLSPL